MILERNTRIICRQLEEQWMLYDPDRRDAMTLNAAGARLYTALGVFTDGGALLRDFAGDDPMKRSQVKKFLGMLQKYGYIAGFTGEIPEEKARTGEISAQYGIGYSMTGTFAPGDRLETVPVNTADVGIGDVIRFSDPAGRMVAHRITGGTPGAWLTMGDNNSAPDEAPVREGELQLVTAVWRRGIRHEVARGKAGMKHFYRYRSKRAWRLGVRRVLKFPALLVIRCCFWRRKPDKATDFGRVIQYSHRGRLIGWRIGSNTVYAAHSLRFFYILPETDLLPGKSCYCKE